MSTLNKDRAELRRLVESYGKEDVIKYVNHINESFLGTTLAIVAGLIGFKLIKGLLTGLIGTGMAVKAKQKLQELEQCQSEMAEILAKYPEAQNKLSVVLRNRLKYVKTREHVLSFAEMGIGLSKVLSDYGMEEEDINRFVELFDQVKYIQDEAFKYYKEETLEKLGGKTSPESQLSRAMFGK